MAEEVKRVVFTRNALDGRTSIPYAAGQEATLLAGVADRHIAAGSAEEIQETEAQPEAPAQEPAPQQRAPKPKEAK